MIRNLFLILLLCGIVLSTAVPRADSEKNDDASPEVKATENVDDITKSPCADFQCNFGQKCSLDSEGKPGCICLEQCPEEPDIRRKVCTNLNQTWQSDCEVQRMRCLCEKSDSRCDDEKYKHVHIEYYGECRDIEDCTPDHLEDFPRRMREWLFNIMDDLAESNELEETYKDLLSEAKTNNELKWINAVMWKFCDLDIHPSDRTVSRHELFPIRAPLLGMEHCIAPFLDACDPDNDHKVSLKEWGKCLGVDPEKITDRCVHN